jgi:imidazoleglycerol-phosphate dehydratase
MTEDSIELSRTTRETRIEGRLAFVPGAIRIATGIGFLDHLLEALATHAGWTLELRCEGDLEVDDHHTAEDCALVLGEGIDRLLGPRLGIRRFGAAYAPLEESLARAVVDCVRRPHATVDLGLRRATIGALATENVAHVLSSLAMSASVTLHVDVLRGENDHHRAEAAFKAVGLAFAEALAPGRAASTKGTLA